MISQTLTVTGANRPIFVTPQGLDLAFSKVLWASINPIENFFSDVGTGIVNTVQRISNLVKGDGFSTNAQVQAAQWQKQLNASGGMLLLSGGQKGDGRFGISLGGGGFEGGVNDAGTIDRDTEVRPLTIAPTASAVACADELKNTGVSFGKNGANAEKVIRAIAKTHNMDDSAAMASVLAANGIDPGDPDGMKKLQGKIAKGDKIQFGSDAAWISGVTQKAYSGANINETFVDLGRAQPIVIRAGDFAQQGYTPYWQSLPNANQSGDIRQAFWN
jgi:hypothetical protein